MPENEAIIRKLEEEIENISRFPDENPHSVIRVSFGGEYCSRTAQQEIPSSKILTIMAVLLMVRTPTDLEEFSNL